MRLFNRSAFLAKLRGRSGWLAFSLVVAVSIGMMLTETGAGNPVVAATLADPLSILAARSPGQRPEGALFQTKRGYGAGRHSSRGRKPLTPVERVLSNVRQRPPPGVPVLAVPNFTGNEFVPAVPDGDTPAAGFSTPGTGGGVALPPIVFAGTTLPPGGTGGGGSGGGTTAPPDVPAVPEPATWLSMIAGFVLIGATLRAQVGRGGRATMPSR